MVIGGGTDQQPPFDDKTILLSTGVADFNKELLEYLAAEGPLSLRKDDE